ncbi:hypothetical protein CDEF62S_03510 [Castellaniella defragrans]
MGVDHDGLGTGAGRFERQVFQQLFHDGVESPGADVLGGLVDRERQFGQAADAVFVEVQCDVFRRKQRRVLLGERGVRGAQNAHEVFGGERIELHPDRKAALQLWNQVRGPRQVKSARGNEEDVIRLHRAVFGVHGGPFDQRQQVALHPLA